jgi:hypothetical protein
MKIKLSQEDTEAFAFNDGPEGFIKVNEVCDYEDMYKDFVPCTTIQKQESTGKLFALDWQKYTSHYGQGEDEFPSNEIYEVEEVEKVKVTKEWKAV